MSTLGRLGFLLVSAAATVCLDDGVPPEARRYIQNDEGENIPVGLLMCAWASSRLTTQIAQLLIQEALGLHASIHPIEGQFGASPFYALAGCDDFDDPFKRKCGDKETVIHVAMDAWIGSYTNTYTQFQTEYPLIAPIDLGSQGYEGEESMYVSNSVIHEAFASSGLVLDFYKSYNSTTGQPKSYFDAVPDIPLEELQTCEDSLFVDPVTMTNYAKFSGDHDGVILQEDGTYIAKCRPDGRWWESPSCRGSFPACIPLFTAGTGWLLQPMMQWSAAYSIPSAITISKKWKQHVESYRSLWYWWVPDSTFIEMSPQAVIFPRHSPSGWLRGDKATGAKGSYVAKMASTNLQSKAPRVQELVQKVLLELDEIMDLLLDVKVKGSVETTACTWIRNNRDRWDRWIASATYCIQGQGLVNADGEFVQKRSEAAGCAVCSSGTYSEDFDDDGKTRRCAKCSPGYSQGESYWSSCEPCGKGTVAPYAGSTECQLCGVGFYQDRVAQTECTPCSANRTTQLLGAGSKDACICKADSIEDQSQTCIACSKGLWCPIGSTVEKLLLANGTIADSPRLEEGYKSERLDPISVYKCSTPQCPGGAPDSCSRGHQGIACANCQPQHYTSFSGECYPCGIDIPSAILVIFSILLIGVFISYYPLTLPYVAKGSGLFCAAASFGIAVGLLQTLGVLNTAISWQAGETPLLHFASLFVFDLDGFGYNCVADRDVELYGITASFFWGVPLCFVILGLVTNLTPLLKRRGLAWQTTKTVNCIGHFLQVASTTMASVGLLPFMCYDHPNGKQSILKYSNTLCGSAEHLSMQIIGTSLLVLSVSFFSMCCFAAWKAPTWSAGPKASSRIPAIVFLIQRFRPSKWWFGLIIVGRGQLLSLPVVFATNMPNLHLMIMLSVQQLYTNLQLWCQPWKSPILNLGDATATSLLLSLLATSLACIDSCNRVMQTLRMIVSIGLVASLGILVSTTCFNFAYAFVTGKQLKVINLGELDSQRVVDGLQKISQFLDSYEKERSAELLEGLSKLCPYDLSCVLEAIDVLLDDWQLAVHSQDSVKRPERSFSGRISAAHGRRGGSSSSKKSPTRPTHVSLWMEKAETKLQDRQPFHVFDMGDDEVPAEHPNINDVLTGLRLADVETSPPEMMDDEEESPSSVIHL